MAARTLWLLGAWRCSRLRAALPHCHFVDFTDGFCRHSGMLAAGPLDLNGIGRQATPSRRAAMLVLYGISSLLSATEHINFKMRWKRRCAPAQLQPRPWHGRLYSRTV